MRTLNVERKLALARQGNGAGDKREIAYASDPDAVLTRRSAKDPRTIFAAQPFRDDAVPRIEERDQRTIHRRTVDGVELDPQLGRGRLTPGTRGQYARSDNRGVRQCLTSHPALRYPTSTSGVSSPMVCCLTPLRNLENAVSGENVELAGKVRPEGRHKSRRQSPILLIDGGTVRVSEALEKARAIVRVEIMRSEERRVGKECRSGWSREQ